MVNCSRGGDLSADRGGLPSKIFGEIRQQGVFAGEILEKPLKTS